MQRKLKCIVSFIFILVSAFSLHAQCTYIGTLGKHPVELLLDNISGDNARAIYTYTNFDEPIVLNGSLKQGVLVLEERDAREHIRAKLLFDNYNRESNKLQGVWKDEQSGNVLQVVLNKKHDLNTAEAYAYKEILQPYSLKKHYFKLLVSKAENEYSARVVGVKIIEKRTDKLLQKINLDAQMWGLDNLQVGDYNFDGLQDFSIFEQSYAGPNTSSKYFLYNPKTKLFFDSGFTGTSLEFDSKTKRIHEHNQCCAGTSVTTAEYKVVNNKMQLLKQECFKWDDAKQTLVKRKLSECE